MLTDSVLTDIMSAVDKAAKSGGLRPQRMDLKQLLPIQRCAVRQHAAESQKASAKGAKSGWLRPPSLPTQR